MAIELSRPIDPKLRAGFAGIEVEISDSVMENLLSAIDERMKDDSDDGAACLLLQAIDSVAKYVDAMRIRSDTGAFVLIDDLWKVYEKLLAGKQDEIERWKTASAEMKKVLDWQRQCCLDSVQQLPVNRSVGDGMHHAVTELMEQQIAEINSLVEQELAALKGEVKRMSQRASRKAELDQEVSAAFAEHVDSLQELLNEEMGRLRHEMQPGNKKG